MIRSFKFIAITISILQLSASCSNSSNSGSGPCDYTEEKFNMFVVDVVEDSTQENMLIVLVDFDGNIEWANESPTLSEVRNVTTDFDFIVNNHIKPGSIYTGTIHKKVPGSGDCEEEIIDWDQKMRK